MSTYFVQRPTKYRRESRNNKRVFKPAPIWTFSSKIEAIEFAKSFQSCWVEVRYEDKVIFRNFLSVLKIWLSNEQAAKVKEHNDAVRNGLHPGQMTG